MVLYAFDDLIYWGPCALVLGLVVSLAFATTGLRLLLITLAGAFIVFRGWSGKLDADGAFDPESNQCTDCGEAAGFAGLSVIMNTLGWTIGALIGGIVRRLQAAHAPRSPADGQQEP